MKKIFILGLALFTLVIKLDAQVSYTWASSGSGSFTTSANWSPNGLPGPSDDVVFNGTSVVNCNFDDDIDVNSFVMTSAYTGTVDALATTPVIESAFNQTGGTFMSTSGNMDVLGPLFSSTGGTFVHNSGDITFYPNTVSTFSIIGSILFNNLNISFSNGGTTTERFMNFGACSANNLFLDGAARPYSYLGSVNILSSLTISGTSTGNPTSNSGTFTFSGAGPIAIMGSITTAQNKIPNVVMNTSGNVSMTGHINIQGNWTGTQGTLVVGTSNENFFGTSASISGPAAAFDNLNIQSGAGVSFPASTEVLVGVNLANSGTISFPSTSTLGLNGTASQAITGSSMTIPSIHAHSGSRTITLSTAIVLLDVLQVDANVTFACGNNLTLHSTNALSARVGPKGAGASITGNVTVRTVIPGGATGWANLGVPGVQSQAISSWDTYSSSGGTTGVPMTCDGCAFGIDALGPDFYSIQGWDEDNDTYDTTITASTLLTPGQGFWVYVGNGASSSTDLMFVNTGALVQGPVSAAVTALGNGDISNGNQVYYNLVANPYPSPIDWDLVFNNNNVFFQAPIYAWSADIGPTSYVSGVSDGGITNLIPAGQGFYVEYNQLGGTNFSLDFNESDKLTFSGNFPLVKPGAAATNSVGQTFRLKLQGSADKSETVFRVHGSATPYFDKALDAHKMFVSPGYVGYPNFYSQYTSLSSKDAAGEDYSIQSLPPLTQGVTIPLVARVSTSGTYTLSAYDFKDFASCVAVVDKVDNSYHDLRLSNYVFSISDTTFASRFDLVLCRDESVNPTGISEAQAGSNSIFINQDQQGAYVKTAFAQNTKATISVYNVIGQKLMNDISVEGMATNTRLNLDLHNQVVLIRVVTDKESSTKRIVMH